MSTGTKTVVVTGDITLDWNLARGRGPEATNPAWEHEFCSRLSWQRGGAALMADLIEAVALQIRDQVVFDVRQPDTPRRGDVQNGPGIGPEDPRFHHSFATWMPSSYAAKDGGKEK